jgi:tetratricopeptide (TPR) repeat protein
MRRILLFLLLSALPLSGQETDDAYRRGVAALDRGEYAAAVDDLLTSLKTRSDHPQTYYRLGLAYRYLGQYDNAMITFNRALEFRTADNEFRNECYLEMIRTALLSGRNKKAVQIGLAALRTLPPNAAILDELARAYLRLGDGTRARKSAELALSLEPDSADSYHLLGLAYLASGLPDSALTSFETAIAFQPKMPQYHAAAGLAAERKGDIAAALKHYSAAATLRPDPEYKNAVKRLEAANEPSR